MCVIKPYNVSKSKMSEFCSVVIPELLVYQYEEELVTGGGV